MRISIAQRLAPFSHSPGAACLLPGTHMIIEAFPALVHIGERELSLHVTGPVRNFTLQQDLEKNCIWIFGRAREGFYRLRLCASREGAEVFGDRLPEQGIKTSAGVLAKKGKLFFPTSLPFSLPPALERLSLGVHRAQDWDLVLRRFDVKEILPFLYAIGQRIPPVESQPLRKLLELPQAVQEVETALEIFLRAAFSKILVPRLKDEEHQGLAFEGGENRFFLLQEAFRQVRALFFQVEDRRVSILPHNPFEAGRALSFQANGIGSFDFEWRQRGLRRAVCRASATGEILLQWPKRTQSFRLRKSEKERGKRQSSSEPLFLETGCTYLLDRFEK